MQTQNETMEAEWADEQKASLYLATQNYKQKEDKQTKT